MRKLKIRTKVAAGLITVLAIFGFVSVYSIWKVKELESMISSHYQGHYVPLTETMTLLQAYQLEQAVHLDRFVRTKDLNQLAEFHRITEAMYMEAIKGEEIAKRRLNSSPSPREIEELKGFLKYLDDVKSRCKECAEAVEKMLASPRAQGSKEGLEMEENLEREVGKIDYGIEQSLKILRKGMDITALEARMAKRRASMTVSGLTALAMAIGVGVALLLNFILKPVGKLAEGARIISSGDFSHRVEITTEDELGHLAEEFNSMAHSLHLRDQKLRAKDEELKEVYSHLIQSEKLSAIGEMAAGIAHEINNPLASIAGYTEDLLDRISETSGGSENLKVLPEYLEIIQKQAYRCKGIISNLLNFAKKRDGDGVEVNVNQAVDEVLSLVVHSYRSRNIEIVKKYATSLPVVTCDPSQLQQVFLNLMNNAIDAVGRDGTITIRTAPEGDGVAITIADTGGGIPEGNLERIYEPFFTTKAGGTGLGLSITRRIVKDLGGEIHAASRMGEGTIFTIEIPASRG